MPLTHMAQITVEALNESISRERVINTVAIITGRPRYEVEEAVKAEDARRQTTAEGYHEMTFMDNLVAWLRRRP